DERHGDEQPRKRPHDRRHRAERLRTLRTRFAVRRDHHPDRRTARHPRHPRLPFGPGAGILMKRATWIIQILAIAVAVVLALVMVFRRASAQPASPLR